MRLFKPGVVIDVSERDAHRFMRLGYKPFVQERPQKEVAPEPVVEEPVEEPMVKAPKKKSK